MSLFPFRMSNYKLIIVLGIACIICFVVGLVFTTGSGEYWLTLFDRYGAMGLTLIAFIEVGLYPM